VVAEINNPMQRFFITRSVNGVAGIKAAKIGPEISARQYSRLYDCSPAVSTWTHHHRSETSNACAIVVHRCPDSCAEEDVKIAAVPRAEVVSIVGQWKSKRDGGSDYTLVTQTRRNWGATTKQQRLSFTVQEDDHE
jgi:hypothetical protein